MLEQGPVVSPVVQDFCRAYTPCDRRFLNAVIRTDVAVRLRGTLVLSPLRRLDFFPFLKDFVRSFSPV